MANMVFGIFSNQEDAETAIMDLQDEGFNPEEISVLTLSKDNDAGQEALQGAEMGALGGGVLGGLAGLLIGVGTIVIPELGPLLFAGPIASALGLTGAAAGAATGAVAGALAGGLIGALVNLGIPEEEAREYEGVIKKGGAVVAINSQDEEDENEISDILESVGAQKVKTYPIEA